MIVFGVKYKQCCSLVSVDVLKW